MYGFSSKKLILRKKQSKPLSTQLMNECLVEEELTALSTAPLGRNCFEPANEFQRLVLGCAVQLEKLSL
jgi:hypothetical protein